MLKQISILLVSLVLSTSAYASLNLDTTINCTYQKGQFLTKKEASNVSNSTPLKWTFNGLNSKKPIFVSGGDTGRVLPTTIKDGVVIYLPSSGGNSTFAIWRTGESSWSKQAKVAGTVYCQQFIGKCVN